MSDWDDDDFEVDTSQITGRKQELGYDIEADELAKKAAAALALTKAAEPKAAFSFKKSEGVDLSAKQIKQKQEKEDRKLAAEMLGEDVSSDEDEIVPNDPLEFIDKLSVDNYKDFVHEFADRMKKHQKEKFYKEMFGLLMGKMAESLEDYQINNGIKSLQKVVDDRAKAQPKKNNNTAAKKAKQTKLLADTVYDEYDEYNDKFGDY
uniref:Eukaryotic translation initiation factor 3 30 kDa subunit n=1 Tax=Rhabditophanes sp. KR3021 TaxID=114890 RepID=A0AC35UE85_9BILA